MMRIVGLDIARFCAFVGMVLVNFRLAAEISPDGTFFSNVIDNIEGRASALFVLLAGIGFGLATPDITVTLKRAAFLFLIGLANMLIFSADILHFYALYFLIGLLFVGQSWRILLLGAFALILGWIAMVFVLNYEAGWNFETLTYPEFWQPKGFVRNALFNGWHPVFPWAAFFLLGMATAKLNLQSKSTQRRLAVGGFLLTLLFNAASGMSVAAVPTDAEFFGLSSIPPGPFYMFAASATALSALGVILLISPMLTRLKLENLLALAGKQSLTLYIAHIVIGMGILEAMGLLDGSLDNRKIFGIAIVFCIVCILYARLWALVARRGPLEILMRKVCG